MMAATPTLTPTPTPYSVWRTAALAEAVARPWRNGGGTTRELAAWPAADAWSWRMSVAEVNRDGPFSPFPGVTRWFAVLNGAGVQLDVGGQTHAVQASSAPLVFDGGDACECTLPDGPTQDFNLMVQSRFPSKMARVNGRASHRVQAGATLAIYAIDAVATLSLSGVRWTAEPGHVGWLNSVQGGTARIESGNALFMEIGL